MTRIAAVLTDPNTVGACLDAAVIAASAVPNEEVEAFHPRLRPESLILPTEEVMTGKRRAALTAMLDAKSKAIRDQVNIWIGLNLSETAPVWIEVEGPKIGIVVAERARTADLVVIGRPSDAEGREALNAAIFDTGRLLLLVPPRRDGSPSFGQHIAIAWKSNEQTRAAVVASVPWLKRAATITVLTIQEGAAPVEDEDEVFSLLHPHDISAAFVAVPKGDESVAECLLRGAHERRADCLVMGAYRHHRIVEMILGGVTRHMLQGADLPIFMLH